jgi:hypothetical protein
MKELRDSEYSLDPEIKPTDPNDKINLSLSDVEVSMDDQKSPKSAGKQHLSDEADPDNLKSFEEEISSE